MPIVRNSNLTTAPAATRAAVSRALARSSTSRASSKPYFCIPARSACPGRTWVSGAAVAPGAGDISACHLSLRVHSVLAISMATGEPSVRPWRTPPISVSSSTSKRWRGPRPKPRRRRASSPWMSSTVTASPAGSPSRMTTSPWPWDSPAVRNLSIGGTLTPRPTRRGGRVRPRRRRASR